MNKWLKIGLIIILLLFLIFVIFKYFIFANILGSFGEVYVSIAYSPDGSTMAVGSSDNNIKLIDVNWRLEIASIETPPVSSLAFSPNGKTLASISNKEKLIKLWDVSSHQLIASLQNNATSGRISFNSDGSLLAGIDGTEVRLWEISSRKEIALISGQKVLVTNAIFSPNSQVLAISGLDVLNDNYIMLWDLGTKREIAKLRGHTNLITSIAFSPDGKLLASGSHDNSVRLWDIATFKELVSLPDHSVGASAVRFSPDGKYLAYGGPRGSASVPFAGNKGALTLYDVQARKEIINKTDREVYCIAFSPNGKVIATCSNNDVVLWNLSDLLR